MIRVNRILRRVLAVYTILIALMFCGQCIGLYRNAHLPQNLNEMGMPEENAYSPEKIKDALGKVRIFSSGYLPVLAGTLVTGKADGKSAEGCPDGKRHFCVCQRTAHGKNPEKKSVLLRKMAGILIALIAVVFIIIGVMNGETRTVMAKAVRICTECIGLG